MATKATKPIPDGFRTVTISLCVDGAAAAIDWYRKALGAEERYRMNTPDGKIAHAELQLGDSVVALSDPMMGAKDPKALGGCPVTLMVFVEDCDRLYRRAVDAGAQSDMPPADMFWGDRFSSVIDPFGFRWSIATHIEDLTPDEMARRGEEAFKKMGPG